MNQFTSVLNRFFLDQTSFELQVIVPLVLDFLVAPGRERQEEQINPPVKRYVEMENVCSLSQRSRRMQSSSELQNCG